MAGSVLFAGDRPTIEAVLQMQSGYVLDFSDRTFSEFFASFRLNINDQKYKDEGTSKAKRLRAFLRQECRSDVGRVLAALFHRRNELHPPLDAVLHDSFVKILARIEAPGYSKEDLSNWRNRYTKEGPLGEGGQAQVFAVTDSQGRLLAVKQALDPADADNKARMKREIEVQQKVRHDNVMPLVDYDRTNFLWLVMPRAKAFLKLRTERDDSGLGRNIEELSDEELLDMVQHVVEGMNAAHEKGYVHRDGKPSNVLLLSEEPVRWAVSDWGIVRKPKGETTVLRTQFPIGTLEFTAPEQLANSHDVDFRADYYSIGRLVAAARCPEPLTLGSDSIPAGIWRRFVRAMTQRDPRRRPQKVDETRELLLSVQVSMDTPHPQDLALAGVRLLLSQPKDSTAARQLLDNFSECGQLDVLFHDDIPALPAEALETICEAGSDAELLTIVELWEQQPWADRDFDHANQVLDSFLGILKCLQRRHRLGALEDVAEVYVKMVAGWDRWRHGDRSMDWLVSLTGDDAAVLVRVLSRDSAARTWYSQHRGNARPIDPQMRAVLT